MDAVKYYQPIPHAGADSAVDIHGAEWMSFEVWESRSVCEGLFPGHEILVLDGGSIERPIVVDSAS